MHEVLNQVLRFNSEIKIGKKVFLWKKWYKCGIVNVKILSKKDLNLWIFQRLRIRTVPV